MTRAGGLLGDRGKTKRDKKQMGYKKGEGRDVKSYCILEIFICRIF